MSNKKDPYNAILHTKLCDLANGTGRIVERTTAENDAAQLRRIELTEKALNEVGLSMDVKKKDTH